MEYVISLAGIVLVLAPWFFGYHADSAATSTSVILGAIIFLVAGYRAIMKDKHAWEDWSAGIVVLLAIAAPFVFRFDAPAFWSALILGIIVAALAGYQVIVAWPAPSHPAGTT